MDFNDYEIIDDDCGLANLEFNYIVDWISTTSQNNLQILHVNIRSAKKNFNNFLATINSYMDKLDIIILSETWLKKYVVCRYKVDGFDMFTFCRGYNEKCRWFVGIYKRRQKNKPNINHKKM